MSQKRTAAQADAAAAAAGIAQAALSQGEGPPSSVAGGRTAARGTGVPPPLVSGEELVALAETLGHFSPTIPDDVIRHYLHKAGLETSDPRVCVDLRWLKRDRKGEGRDGGRSLLLRVAVE